MTFKAFMLAPRRFSISAEKNKAVSRRGAKAQRRKYLPAKHTN